MAAFRRLLDRHDSKAHLIAFFAQRRALLVLIAIAGVAAVVFAALPRGTGDSPEAAIYALAHAVEHRDAKAACERLVDAAALATATRNPRGCGEMPEAIAFRDPLVYSVQDLEDLRGAQAACAKVAFSGGGPQSVLLVRPTKRWRVVRTRNSATSC